MAKDSNAVDAVMALSIARLQGLCAQHHGCNQDASDHFEEGIAGGLKCRAADNLPGIQWLLQDLVTSLRLAQADISCCMVKPSSKLPCQYMQAVLGA